MKPTAAPCAFCDGERPKGLLVRVQVGRVRRYRAACWRCKAAREPVPLGMTLLARGRGSTVYRVLVDAADWPALLGYTWRTTRDGYVFRFTSRREAGRVKSVRVYLHRHLLGLAEGDPLEGDHLNSDPLDNRRCNLERVSRRENMVRLHIRRRAPDDAHSLVAHEGDPEAAAWGL